MTYPIEYLTLNAAIREMKQQKKSGSPVCVVGTTDGKYLVCNLYSAIARQAKLFAY